MLGHASCIMHQQMKLSKGGVRPAGPQSRCAPTSVELGGMEQEAGAKWRSLLTAVPVAVQRALNLCRAGAPWE